MACSIRHDRSVVREDLSSLEIGSSMKVGLSKKMLKSRYVRSLVPGL
jgi:hypothetical protein